MKNTTRIPNFITSAPTTDSGERVSPDCPSLSPNDTQPEDTSEREEESKRDDALTSPQKEGGRERSTEGGRELLSSLGPRSD